MKYKVNISKINNGYKAECAELNILVLGKSIDSVKKYFAQKIVEYSKQNNNSIIDFVWVLNF